MADVGGFNVILCFLGFGTAPLPFARGASSSLSTCLRFSADGFVCLAALVFVIFGRVEAGAGVVLARSTREGKAPDDGGTPSAGVGGCDLRTSLIFGIADPGVAGGGDMAKEAAGAEGGPKGFGEEMDGELSPPILSVRRFAPGRGRIPSMMNLSCLRVQGYRGGGGRQYAVGGRR